MICHVDKGWMQKICIDCVPFLLILKKNQYFYRCKEYWEQRLRMERKERVKQVKEHWETQCRAFVGI